MCFVRREIDLPRLPPLLRCLQLLVDGGDGTLAVLAAVGEGKRTFVSVRLHCWKLTEQVIYIHVPQDWPAPSPVELKLLFWQAWRSFR